MSTYTWGRVWPSPADTRSARAANPSAQQVTATTDQASSASCGYKHTVLLTKEGQLYSFGSNAEGQLGRPGPTAVPSRVTGDLNNHRVVAVACGAVHTSAVDSDGAVFEFGSLFEKNDARLPGEDEAGQHALPGLAERFNRNEYLRRIVMRSEAAYLSNRPVTDIVDSRTATAGAGGPAEVEGEGTGQGLGVVDNTPVDLNVLKMKVTRVRVDKPRLAKSLRDMGAHIVGVACGYGHSLAWDVHGRLYACGYSDRGQLGLGHRIASADYTRVNSPVLRDEQVTWASCGQQHSICVTASGKAFSWGSGALGQLGHGDSDDRLSPTLIRNLSDDGHIVVDAACGAVHSLLVTDAGGLFFFGHSEYGQAGTSTRAGDLVHTSRYYYIPRLVEDLRAHRVLKVAAGGQFSVALLADGTAVSFGWDAYHCLGHGLDRSSADFGRVGGLAGKRVVSVAAGYNHAAVVVAPEGHPFAAAWGSLLRAANKLHDDALVSAAASAVASAGDGGVHSRAHVRSPPGSSSAVGDQLSASMSLTSSIWHGAADSELAVGASNTGTESEEKFVADAILTASPANVQLIGSAPAAYASAGPIYGGGRVGGAGGGTVLVAGLNSTFTGGRPPIAESSGDFGSISGSATWIASSSSNAGALHADGGSGSGSAGTVSGMAAVRKALADQIAKMATSRSSSGVKVAVSAEESAEGARRRAGGSNDAVSALGFAPGSKGGGAAPAVVLVPEPPVQSHALIMLSRCPLLGKAMQEAHRLAAVTPGNSKSVVQVSGGAACTSITVACTLDRSSAPSWTVEFPGVRRIVLHALATFLYADHIPSIPSHRVLPLKHLAEALALPRLATLCDKLLNPELYVTLTPAIGARSSAASAADADAVADDIDLATPEDSTFIQDMRQSLAAGTLSDLDVVVSGPADAIISSSGDAAPSNASVSGSGPATVSFRVHKLVLFRYDFFRRMMQGGFAEAVSGPAPAASISASGSSDDARPSSVSVLHLSDIDVEALRGVLDYMYTGDVKPLASDADSCMRTLALASRLCIPDLVSQGQDIMAQRLGVEDAPTAADFAETFGLPRLLKYAKALLALGADGGRGRASGSSAGDTGSTT